MLVLFVAVPGYQRAFYPNHSVSEIDEYINGNFERFVEHLHILPGCEQTLEATVAALGGDMSRMAICTNSPLPIVQVVMKHCPVLRKFFTMDRVFCAGDLIPVPANVHDHEEHALQRLHMTADERSALAALALTGSTAVGQYQIKAKPTGDLIYASTHRLGLRPELCLFVGDSKFDIISSTGAGCFAVGIGDKAQGGHFLVDSIATLGHKMRQQRAAIAKEHAHTTKTNKRGGVSAA